MSKTTTQRFSDLPKETLLGICDTLGGDGHGLYDPAFLTELGVPQQLVESVTNTYKSDTRSPKSTIFKDGAVVPETTSVYSLTLYRRINHELGLPSSTAMGRGFEARQLDQQIREHLNK